MVLGTESFIVQKQEDAGSLANFLPDSREVENKYSRTLATDVENEEVISFCELKQWLTQFSVRFITIMVYILFGAFREQLVSFTDDF